MGAPLASAATSHAASLGLEVKLDQVPEYFNAKQRRKYPKVQIFGAEFRP
jgi:hypothetical protein